MACVGVTLLLHMVLTKHFTAAGSAWSEKGIFARMMAGLAAEHGEKTTVMIDATHLKAHRTATSMAVKKGGVVA